MNDRPVLLLVEDNAGDAGLATEAAAWFGIDAEIAWVNDGEEALSWLRGHLAESRACPRLIVLDLNLPRVSGHEFLRRLRCGGGCKAAPVIIFSSSNRAEDRRRAEEMGVRHYVVKPRTWDEYLEAFRVIAEAWRVAAEGKRSSRPCGLR